LQTLVLVVSVCFGDYPLKLFFRVTLGVRKI